MTVPFKRSMLLIVLAISFAALFLFGVTFWRLMLASKQDTLPVQVEFQGQRFTLERAITEAQREKGLGGRESLCQACAMLFVFEKPGQYAFWMKDMRFPIDIVWLSGTSVVFVAHEVSPDYPGIIGVSVDADKVIELNAGVARNVNVGGKVQFSY